MKRKNTISVRRVIIVVCTVMSESIDCLACHRWEVKGPYHYLLIGTVTVCASGTATVQPR